MGRRRRGLRAKGHRLKDRIENRSATVAVVGGGYVGLPLAIAFARAGFYVAVVDRDASRVEAIKAGEIGRAHV